MAFFTRRGIEAIAVATIEDLLQQLTAAPTPFVLLSVNFAHPKLESLPALLKQKFNTQCLAFAELTDRKTEGRLANIKARQVIHGAVSGLAVLTRIRQVEQETLNADSTKPIATSSQTTSPPSNNRSAADAQTAGTTSEPRAAISNNPEVKVVTGTLPSQDGRVAKGPPNNVPPLADQFKRRAPQNDLPPATPGAKAAAQLMTKLAWSASVDTIRRLSFLECACNAIKEIQPNAEITLDPLKAIRSAGLLMVSNKQKSNYVIVASETEPYPSPAVLNLKKTFLQHAQKKGIETPLSQTKMLMLQKVVVPVETFSRGEFSITARYDSTAVGLSYLELPAKEPLIQNKSNEFTEIKIIEIAEDLPLTFDVFVFLPRNKKYLRFSPAGSEFAENRRNRLLAAGRKTVLVRTQDVPHFHEHYIWAQIRSGIETRRT